MDLNSKGLSRILLSAFTALTLTNCGGESGADSAEDDVASSDTESNHVLFTERANNHQVFMAEDGNGVAVWSAENESGNDSIWSSHYELASDAWSTAIEIANYDGDINTFDAAKNNNGTVQIVWQQSNPSISFVIKDQVWGNYYQPASGWASPTLINDLEYSTSSTSVAGTPKVTLNDSDIGLVVWKQVDSSGVGSSIKSIYSMQFDALTGWSSETLISNAVEEDLENLYDVSMNGSGNAVMVWSDEEASPSFKKQILYSFYSAGTGWSVTDFIEENTADDINNFNTIELQQFQNDDVVVLWEYLTSSTATRTSNGRQYTAMSTSWDAAYEITPSIDTSNRAFDIEFNKEGEGVYVFTELLSGGIFPLNVQMFNVGSGFGASQTISGSEEALSLLTGKLAIDDDANAVAVSGQDHPDGNGSQIKTYHYDPANGWSAGPSFGEYLSGSSVFDVDIVPDGTGDSAMALHIENENISEYQLVATKIAF